MCPYGLVVPHIGMATVPVHMPEALGDTAVGKQNGNLVNGFRSQGEEIPHHVGVLGMPGRGYGVRLDFLIYFLLIPPSESLWLFLLGRFAVSSPTLFVIALPG